MEDLIAGGRPDVPFHDAANDGGADSRGTRGCCDGARSCVRVVTCAILLSFACLMLSIGIAWHVIRPHEPGFHVESLSVSNFTASDSEVGGKYDVGLTIRNPNEKVEVWLDRFKVGVCYGEARLADCSAEAIRLEKRTEKTDVVGPCSGSFGLVGNKRFSGDMGKEWRKEVVKLNVKIRIGAKYEYGILPSRERVLDVYCGDLDVFFSAKTKDTGKLLGIGRDCHVNIIG